MAKELKVKRFEGEALEWLQKALAFGWCGMDDDMITRTFFQMFPAYLETAAVETEAEAAKIVKTRLRKMRTDVRGASYFKIQNQEKEIRSHLDMIPIASPFTRLIVLDKLLEDKSLKPETIIKVVLAAEKIVNNLSPQEKSSSSLWNQLPNLPRASESSDVSGSSRSKSLGGAMMANVEN